MSNLVSQAVNFAEAVQKVMDAIATGEKWNAEQQAYQERRRRAIIQEMGLPEDTEYSWSLEIKHSSWKTQKFYDELDQQIAENKQSDVEPTKPGLKITRLRG